VKSRFTIYILLVAALIVIAKNYWLKEDSWDSYQGRAVLKTPGTNTPSGTNTPKVAAPLETNVQPTVIVIPADILLPPGPLPSGLMIAIAIQNNTSTNLLRLSEPTVNVPGVGIEISELEPGKSFIAQLGFPQGFVVLPGRQVEFLVKTSDPNLPVIRVPVKQMQRAP
jgi:hypothetical protein